ncbi:MAG TPA: hypothetical protein VJ183_04120 [Chloroflexia bacterium]|nr:hypothetical protein [Chloroflexia bacterium]
MGHNHTGHGGHEGHGGIGQVGSSQNNAPEDLPGSTFGTHNQMMVGEQTIFLSHLPMFMFDPADHAHNFQVILEVTLSGSDSPDPQGKYVEDRRSPPNERMYTMQPAPFEMVELDPRHPRRDSFKGIIYRGHLERGGVEIIGHIDPVTEKMISPADVQVVNIVYFHKFDPNAQPLAQLEYLLFGKGQELFLAHIINKPPDFDQLLSVTVSGHQFTAEELSRGIRIRITGRANTFRKRIKKGERVIVQAQLTGAQVAPPLQIQITAGTEFYFEEGELRLPMTMDPTPEEIASGF